MSRARKRRGRVPRGERTRIVSEALVLHSSEWSESSRVVKLLLPQQGLVTILARGVERANSAWRGIFDLLCRVELEIEEESGRELHGLRQARLLEHHPVLRTELTRWYHALYAAELTAAAAQPAQSAPDLYRAFASALSAWNRAENDADRILLHFEWALLDALGLRPALSACASCGRPIDPSRSKTALFHPAAGGVQCSPCRSHAKLDLMPALRANARAPWRRVAVETLITIDRVRDEIDANHTAGDPVAERTARLLLDDFLAWQLERPSRVRPFLR